MVQQWCLVVIGGGPAGFFGAIACAEAAPHCRVLLLERHAQLLAKVRVSGGGRCNVTHACFDPARLVQNYPRGAESLRGPCSRFQPRDTIAWFEKRGVQLKTESDGRMFPVTDSSQTIIDCLVEAAARAGVEVRTQTAVETVQPLPDGFDLHCRSGEKLSCAHLLLATGSAPQGHLLAQQLGHHIVPPVPSLFTFNIPTSPLHELAGISVPLVQARLPAIPLQQEGPLLITHWGFSGPAILKLSAWGARHLHALDYRTELRINWLPALSQAQLKAVFVEARQQQPRKTLGADPLVSLPKNLWKALVKRAGLLPEQRLGTLSNHQQQRLIETLQLDSYQIEGKTTYKEEFVTAGGIALKEVNFKTLESLICPRLYLAGEILDIDGITGGFNFQNSWTTGWLAGHSIALGKNSPTP